MKLVVLGANGQTGQQVVRKALSEGMDVTAIVRHADRDVGTRHERLKTLVGDPCNPSFLRAAFQGQDAVISTLGGRRPTKAATAVYYRSAEAITKAAEESGLARVLVTSTALLFRDQPLIGRLLQRLVPNIVTSAARMEHILRASDLRWTIARPGFLTNSDQDTYQSQKGAAPAHGTSVSRRALARFLVAALASSDTEGEVLGIATGTRQG